MQLNFGRLADIDFAGLMDQVNEVIVPLWPDVNPLETDTNNNDDLEDDSDTGSSGSEDLMQQLVSLTQKQKGAATATISCGTSGNSTSNTAVGATKSGVKTVDSSVQADDLYSDAGTMAMQTTASIGVSALFGMMSAVDPDRRKPKERGTIFLDLRNQKIEPKKHGKVC